MQFVAFLSNSHIDFRNLSICISQLVEKSGTIRKPLLECKVVEECEFFKWYVDGGNYGKGKFTKEKVDAALRKHACGLDKGLKKDIYTFHFEKHISIIYIYFSFESILNSILQ